MPHLDLNKVMLEGTRRWNRQHGYNAEESLADIVREQRRRYPPAWRKLLYALHLLEEPKVPDYSRIAELERELGVGVE